MGGKEPEAPAYQGGITKFGDRTVSTNQKIGNDVVTQYNPTTQETQAYDYLQSQLPALYQKSMSPSDFTSYANAYAQNQKDQLNKDYTSGLNTLKGSLVSSGNMGSSQGLDKLRPLQTAYLQSMSDINANAPIMAQTLQSNDLNYNSGLLQNALNSLNNYYNTGNIFAGASNTLSNMGNAYEQTAYKNKLAEYERQQKQQAQNIQLALMAAGALATGGASLAGGGALMSGGGAGSAILTV